jgi:uncharacterized protein (DUF488 family)
VSRPNRRLLAALAQAKRARDLALWVCLAEAVALCLLLLVVLAGRL